MYVFVVLIFKNSTSTSFSSYGHIRITCPTRNLERLNDVYKSLVIKLLSIKALLLLSFGSMMLFYYDYCYPKPLHSTVMYSYDYILPHPKLPPCESHNS